MLRDLEIKIPHPQQQVVEAGAVERDRIAQLNRYAKLKHEQTLFADYIIANHPEERKLVEKLQSCGSHLIYNCFYDGDKSNIVANKLAGGFTCQRHLFCRCCAMRRSAIYAKTFEAYVRSLLLEHPHLAPILITYTVKNGPDLLERFKHLRKAQQLLISYRRWVLSNKSTARGIDTVLRHVLGGAGSYEFKIGSGSKLWHPHIHEIALLDSREYVFTEELLFVKDRSQRLFVPQVFKAALRAEWKSLTGDSDQVDVRGLYPREGYSRLVSLQDTEEASVFDKDDPIFSGVSEAFKYALVPEQMTHEEQYYAAKTLQGCRLLFTYGLLRGVQLPDESFDDIDQFLSDLPYFQKIYQYFQQGTQFSYMLIQESGDFSPSPILHPSRKTKTSRKKVYSDKINPKSVSDFMAKIQSLSETPF
jgi:hypothetical protein